MLNKTAVLLGTSLALALTACGGEEAPKSSALSNVSCPANPPGQCDQNEVNQYGLCIADRCDASYKECFGPTYRSGTFTAGPCATYYTCLARCTCNDNACRAACGIAPTACQICVASKVAPCANSSGCTRPACTGPAPPGGNTCADLARCCAAITDPFTKELCQSEYAMARQYGDYICTTFVQSFRQTGMCP